MTPDDLKDMPVSDLVGQFAALGVAQYWAMMRGEQRELNRLMFEMRDVTEELMSRPGDGRTALLPLYTHPNIQVRLMAARLTAAIAPAAAKRLLQEIAASKDYPQAFHAGMSLSVIENGKP